MNFKALEVEMQLRNYKLGEIEAARRAYEMAEYLHRHVKRESGEPYIVHPLSTALILVEYYADVDTLCGALLHDVIEDTEFTKEDIANYFNHPTSILVDGVTKLKGLKLATKQSIKYANERKMNSILLFEPRCNLIKLADKLHNMRTIQYKRKRLKQIENSLEALDTQVPISHFLGASKFENELSNLAFQCLAPDEYKRVEEIRSRLQEEKKSEIESLKNELHKILKIQNITGEIQFRIKNNYQLYQKIRKGKQLTNIHDLLALKLILKNINQCYSVFDSIRSNFQIIEEDTRDFIVRPKENLYQSLHLGIQGENNSTIQIQLKTERMNRFANGGYAAFWYYDRETASTKMREELRKKRFFNSLKTIDEVIKDNQKFVQQVRYEVFNKNIIHLYTPSGDMFDLPEGATPIDFAYMIHSELLEKMSGARVNGVFVPLNYKLQNGDTVQIITDEKIHIKGEWESYAVTTGAKRIIRKKKI